MSAGEDLARVVSTACDIVRSTDEIVDIDDAAHRAAVVDIATNPRRAAELIVVLCGAFVAMSDLLSEAQGIPRDELLQEVLFGAIDDFGDGS